ncbi:MAG: type II secretion system protein GspJ [Planctomycetota bacterium]|jgi:type II secretory pathway component PulJ
MRRRAFSLLEVLVAIGLVILLFGSMFTFMYDTLSARGRALEHAGRQLAAVTLIERAELDLMSCIVGDRVYGAGVEGDNTSLRTLTRGLATHLAGRGTGDPVVFGDLQQVEYRFEEDRGRIEARRRPAGVRGPDRTPFAPLGGTVYKVRFRYHDGSVWRDSYDSMAEGRLPEAVEIAVWFHPWPGEQRPEEEDPALEIPERLTFDATAGFDEAAYARESDLELFDEPEPDRIRVIVVPDASADDPYAQPQEPLDVALGRGGGGGGGR